MASLRISQLAELLAADVSSNDLLAIVDQSASETKNVQIESLAKSLGPLFPDGSIPGSKVVLEVPDGSIDTAALANQSVTESIKQTNVQQSSLWRIRHWRIRSDVRSAMHSTSHY